jgi:hypothetical protein
VSRYEDAFARVVGAAERPMALLLRGVDRADPRSIEMLVRLFAGQHKPKWPLLISFERRHPSGVARLLLEQLERVLPAEAFWHEAGIGDGGSAAVSELLTRTSSGTLRILRAAAAMGDRFEIEVVGHLLGLDELTVLDGIQEALDLGLSLEDRGQGVFRFDPSVAAVLREQTLPALTRAWRERLAERFGGTPAPGEAVDAQPSSAAPGTTALANGASELGWSESAPPGSLAHAPSTGSASNPPPTDAPVTPREARECFEVPAGLAALPGDPRTDAWWQRLNAAAMHAHAGGASPGGERAAASEPRLMVLSGAAQSGVAGPEPKAADGPGAAELGDGRCERELAAAERLALLGQHEQALASSALALALADSVDDPERQRVLRARALLMIGQSRWQYRGPAAASSLELALEPLAQARELVANDEPPELSAQIAAMIANVCYDLGTPEALERALVELTRASQVLLAAERPLDAARLLNDEAALWVKIGDPVRAHYLLARSREVFGKVADGYPAARHELLETEHLLARLVLHASARPGREREAVYLAIQHALAAEQGYRELKDERELARVWETLGRLELRLGRLDEAAQRLEDAQRLQRQIGDGIGLARSSSAMSDVFVEARDYPRALSNLGESITLNSEKGSGAGLQTNLASLRKIEGQLPDGLLPEARALGQRLVRALTVS